MECVKKSFSSLSDAMVRLAEIRDTKDNRKKPLRAYKCKNCKKYHLTSMTKIKYKIYCTKEGQLDTFLKKESGFWAKKLGVLDFEYHSKIILQTRP